MPAQVERYIIGMEEILRMFRGSPEGKTKDPMQAFYYIFVLCLSEFYFGYTLVYLSAVDFNILAKQFGIDFDFAVAQGVFQGITPIGGAVGAISSAYFIGLFSRRNIVFFFNAVAVALCLLSLITNYQLFFLVRFLQGAICGLFSAVIPMIIKEISPHEISSITGSFANAFIIFGLFFLYLFGYLLKVVSGDITGGSTWRVVFFFPILTIAFQTLILIKVYPFETPKYLAHNNKTAQLRELMAEFYKAEHVSQMHDHYMKHHGPAASAQEEDHRKSSAEGQVKDNKGSKCALIYGLFYSFLCPMAGINVMMSYGGQVVSKIAPELRSIMPAILMLFYLMSAILSLALIKRYGRKELTIMGTVGLIITLSVIAFAYFISSTNIALSQFLIVIFLFIYLLVYGVTYAPVMWMWVSEALLPHTIGYAIFANWCGAALVMILFPILLEMLPDNNPAYIFLFFDAFLVLSLIVTKNFMLETKDKFEHEIMEEYRKLDEQYFGKTDNAGSGVELQLIDNKK